VRRLLLSLGITLVLSVTTACGGDGEVTADSTPTVSAPVATPAPEPAESTPSENGEINSVDLSVGDCLATRPGADGSDLIENVTVVDCSQPHAAEVYAQFALPDGDFPGDDAVQASAQERCVPEFEAFVGVSFDVSELDIEPIKPSARSWGQGDRDVVCLVIDPASPTVSGSLEGANR